jgi:hypothetical protein
MLKNGLIIFCTVFIFSACKTGKESAVAEVKSTDLISTPIVKYYIEFETNKGKEVLIYGKIIQKEFVNKGGRNTGVMETLLQLNDGETVHIRNKGENKYDYEKLAGKNVEMKAIIFYGNIDSDNPEHQSRVGFRIDYTEIRELN